MASRPLGKPNTALPLKFNLSKVSAQQGDEHER